MWDAFKKNKLIRIVLYSGPKLTKPHQCETGALTCQNEHSGLAKRVAIIRIQYTSRLFVNKNPICEEMREQDTQYRSI